MAENETIWRKRSQRPEEMVEHPAPAKRALLRPKCVLVVGGLGGIIFWGGFNTAMEATSTMGFCISCHEMRNSVYEEYKKTVHYSNRTGVRAICSDCHVPKEWTAKLMRKIEATFNEVPHKIMGTVDTPEKFEAKRLELAKHEVGAPQEERLARSAATRHEYEGNVEGAQTPTAWRSNTRAPSEKRRPASTATRASRTRSRRKGTGRRGRRRRAEEGQDLSAGFAAPGVCG